MSGASFELAGKRVWIAGHRGMVGAALMRRLAREGCEILTAGRDELDLRRQTAVEEWTAAARPQVVLLAAAKVGGILANANDPVGLLYDNLMIEANVIHAAHRAGVEKLLFVGSACVYPREAPQPIAEDALLAGPPEPTNEWPAIAKIAGVKLAQAYRQQHGRDFISALPTNLYGPGDDYDPETSHVVGALLRKAHEARRAGRRDLEIWGTGTTRREFLHVDDCADALVLLVRRYSDAAPVNIGSGVELTVEELARTVMRVVGLDGAILKDPSKPDGRPSKRLDASRLLALGWRPSIALEEGLRRIYAGMPFAEAA
jgi:GDP-L-fucose synthase